MDDRYARQTMLPDFGTEGQSLLQNAKVLIVGVGGLGSPISLYLAGAGVGYLGLIDADVVSVSNLQRQVLYTEDEVGLPKVDCAKKRLKALNNTTKINAYYERLEQNNAEEIIKQYDIIVDGCDNFETRYLIDELSHKLNIPYVFGSIGEYAGMVSVFNHKDAGRFSQLFPKETIPCNYSLPKGVLGPLPGIIGSIEAMEVIKIITQCGTPLCKKLLTIDSQNLLYNIIDI